MNRFLKLHSLIVMISNFYKKYTTFGNYICKIQLLYNMKIIIQINNVYTVIVLVSFKTISIVIHLRTF